LAEKRKGEYEALVAFPIFLQEDCKVGILRNAVTKRQEKINHRDTETTEMP